MFQTTNQTMVFFILEKKHPNCLLKSPLVSTISASGFQISCGKANKYITTKSTLGKLTGRRWKQGILHGNIISSNPYECKALCENLLEGTSFRGWCTNYHRFFGKGFSTWTNIWRYPIPSSIYRWCFPLSTIQLLLGVAPFMTARKCPMGTTEDPWTNGRYHLYHFSGHINRGYIPGNHSPEKLGPATWYLQEIGSWNGHWHANCWPTLRM